MRKKASDNEKQNLLVILKLFFQSILQAFIYIIFVSFQNDSEMPRLLLQCKS